MSLRCRIGFEEHQCLTRSPSCDIKNDGSKLLLLSSRLSFDGEFWLSILCGAWLGLCGRIDVLSVVLVLEVLPGT